MSLTITTALRAARNGATLALMDAGGAGQPAVAELYAGMRGDVGGSVRVASAPFAHPAAVLQEDGSLLLSIAAEVLASADGAPNWVRVKNGLGVVLFEGDVTLPGAGGDFQLAPSGVASPTSTQVWAGGALQLASGSLG